LSGFSTLLPIDSGEEVRIMKKMFHVTLLMMAMMIALVVNSVSALPVTSIPGGTVVSIPGVNYEGLGPQYFGPGITWSSTYPSSIFGYTNNYGYGSNGLWDGKLGPMAGLNSISIGTMTFAFSTPVTGVGGFINYVPDFSSSPTTIAVYDAGMNLIESEILTFHTDGSTNSGEFHGFLETSPKISFFTLSNNVIGITTLTTLEGAAQSLTLQPLTATNTVGSMHTLTATYTPPPGVAPSGKAVNFEITAGPNKGMTGGHITDVNGVATWSYTSTLTGTDTIYAFIIFTDAPNNDVDSNLAYKTWVTGSNNIPEFPSMFLPATMIIGFLGAVLLIQRTKEN